MGATQTSKSILEREETGGRTIKIANSRALEFLIRDGEAGEKKRGRGGVGGKRSHFHPDA